MQSSAARLTRLDTLRGLAVFGILLVNIWSFSWGFQSFRYGVLPPSPTLADQAAIVLTALLAEHKFYPVFAFLFGAGFALHTRSLRRTLGDWRSARAAYRRRLAWLLCCGVLHGTLVWFGDILSLYALAGFVVLAHLAGAPLARVLAHLRRWLATFTVLLGATLLLGLWAPASIPGEPSALHQLLASHAVYTTGTLREIAAERIGDYTSVMLQSVFLLPHVAVLFLLGVVSVRAGWLTRPHRHAVLWRRVRAVGLAVGVPFNLAWAAVALVEALNPTQPPAWSYILYAFLPLGGAALAAALVAQLMLSSDAQLRPLATWIAPVGRMALTNYLMQSILCALLLQGAGLGLGATLSHAGLAALALGIMLLQVWSSRWWLRGHAQGPAEVLYRRAARRPIPGRRA